MSERLYGGYTLSQIEKCALIGTPVRTMCGRIRRLEKALEFYGRKELYRARGEIDLFPRILNDDGETACKALRGENGNP